MGLGRFKKVRAAAMAEKLINKSASLKNTCTTGCRYQIENETAAASDTNPTRYHSYGTR